MMQLLMTLLGGLAAYVAVRFLAGLLDLDPESWGHTVRREVSI